MSSTWLEDLDTEFAEYDDSEAGELYDEGEAEDYDAEARSAADRRRARQRRMALARRRQAQARARSRPASRLPARPSAQQTVSAIKIKNLDLETKVQEDAFRSSISAQSKRMSRAEYAAVAGAAVNQFIESFEAPDNPFAKAALRFAPLLLLSPQPRGKGFEAFAKDPRVVGGAAVGAITIAGANRNRFSAAREIRVTGPTELVEETDDQFIADVVDGRGAVLDKPVTWKSSKPAVATITEATGDVHAVAPGVTVIIATADGILKRERLTVTADWAATPPQEAANPPAKKAAAAPAKKVAAAPAKKAAATARKR